MTRDELLRVLNFAGSLRKLGDRQSALASIDARWNIITYAMKRHLEGKLLTITSLADAAEVPYGTAMRRIGELIDEGLLLRRSRSKSGKSFSLHPTRDLISQFEAYAADFKRTVGDTFGFTDDESEGTEAGFYFGGHYMASRILSYPNAMRVGIGKERVIRVLGPIDPTFKTLKELTPSLNELCGAQFEFTNLPLDQLHHEIFENQKRTKSKYDIVAVDLPWIGQLANSNVIMPLNDILEKQSYRGSDFHATIWHAARYRNQQYGIPIQPTVELLFCRRDLLDEVGLSIPRTTEELLQAAKALHGARRDQSGIVMNYGRGTPVAHTFMQTLADFGSPVIDLSPRADGFDTDSIDVENFRPLIDTEAGRETAQFLLDLLPYAHPDSLRCDWDRRISIFSAGKAAMTYGWSIRAARFEQDDESVAQGNVVCTSHPAKFGLKRVSPVGGFVLALPASISSDRIAAAWKAMEYLTRPELMKLYVQHGSLTSPRFSTSADPEVQSKSSMIQDIDQMEQNGTLQVWPRPPIPEFADIVSILGEEIYLMLQQQKLIPEALGAAQSRIEQVLQQRTH
ncbi:putative ABC transporter periplasmatic solute-binding protein [Octadecabacter antarcticus 307]|uniref:Putative ABC transporter periplasmatic solute-binding protein n=1 Tax=Octadecabacter antarcticus 307 TaxID=391626 RepID=M9R9J8_9RHOB|nr:extracellular solute-binding protein [Octadecabacter antarcticus]AGI69344.1 putative ABC transporter periplasmatic solute-binding protein [Octadecabacter antarcticus 307]